MQRNKDHKPAPKPYVYSEYPRTLYKEGAPRPIAVRDEAEEERMTAQGWGRKPVDPPPPMAPMSETEIALDRQFRAHKTVVDRIVEQHAEEMRQAKVEISDLKEKYAQLLEANGVQTIDRAALLEKNSALESQIAAMVGELRDANSRADGMVAELGRVTSEMEAARKQAAAAKAVHGNQNQKKEN